MRKKLNQGFTLIETMVGMAILLIAFISSLTVFNMVQKGQAANEASLGYVSAHNQLMSLLIDDTSWAKMVSAPGNTANPLFSCLEKQDSLNAGDRDCFGKTAPLVIYDIKGNPYVINGVNAYDFRSLTQGFSAKGQACDTYSAPPAAGNPQCPFQVVVKWSAVCLASPCINPPIRFQGQTTFNGGPEQAVPNTNFLNFQLYKTTMYCPPQAVMPSTQTTATPATVDVGTIDRVRSLVNTDVPTTDVASTDAVITPCRRITVNFSEDLDPVFISHANNQSSVYIRDESTGTNVFEFRRIGSGTAYDYQLYEGGVAVVNNKPSWATLTKLTIFRFDITNGLLRFCVDDRCTHYFSRKLDFPFRVIFQPASSLFTPNGFNTISYSVLDM